MATIWVTLAQMASVQHAWQVFLVEIDLRIAIQLVGWKLSLGGDNYQDGNCLETLINNT